VAAFTSSPAGAMCSPFASIYGSTKAFLTEFAMSLAPEVKYNGIDVVVVHPSPAHTFSKVRFLVTLCNKYKRALIFFF
jgi:short-subunit dehydrogenase